MFLFSGKKQLAMIYFELLYTTTAIFVNIYFIIIYIF